MQGNVLGQSGGGDKVNGNVTTYTAGENIDKGAFVRLSGSTAYKITSSNQIIKGIAKTNGTTGNSIKVYI